MAANTILFKEGLSLERPPLFNGENYPCWKKRMENFLKVVDFDLWEVIQEGPFIPYTTNSQGEKVVKEREEYTEVEKKKVQLNYKASNALLCALTEDEFITIQYCDSAKEIWDTLKNIYDDNPVKEVIATWSDEESTSSEEEEEEEEQTNNICLMALEEHEVNSCSSNEISNSVSNSMSIAYTFDELQDAYDELVFEFQNASTKWKNRNLILKNENEALIREKKELENRIEILEKDKHELVRKNEVLNDALSKTKDEPKVENRSNNNNDRKMVHISGFPIIEIIETIERIIKRKFGQMCKEEKERKKEKREERKGKKRKEKGKGRGHCRMLYHIAW